MPTFSERKGLTAVSNVVQVDAMNDALKNSLWNVLDQAIWSTDNFVWASNGRPGIVEFARHVWSGYFKLPVDTIPASPPAILKAIRNYFFGSEWYEVYDFVEFVADLRKHYSPKLPMQINRILDRELSGYRMVLGQITDITHPEEVAMLSSAMADEQFAGVSAHLRRSFELYSNRENPDYRNSIKEAISAVESMARIVSDDRKATLGDALKSIEKRGDLHKALKEGFLKLYGYTSDEGGIRHAMLDEPNITASDAKYFLLSCTSFVNYLKTKMP